MQQWFLAVCAEKLHVEGFIGQELTLRRKSSLEHYIEIQSRAGILRI
jgi:hypothetical protein